MAAEQLIAALMTRTQKSIEAFDVWSSRDGAIDELCEAVCATAGATLSAWCNAKGFLHFTVRDWITSDERRAAMFELANRRRAHLIADEIGTLAWQPIPLRAGRPDALAMQHRRLLIETLQWICAQLNPQYRMRDGG